MGKTVRRSRVKMRILHLYRVDIFGWGYWDVLARIQAWPAPELGTGAIDWIDWRIAIFLHRNAMMNAWNGAGNVSFLIPG